MSKVLSIRNTFSIFAKSVEYMKQNLIERQGYSERIERMFGKGMVVALTGQRRVGKSCVTEIDMNEEQCILIANTGA